MKNIPMKKNCFLLFSLIVSFFWFSSCHKCQEAQLPSQTFSQQELNVNPYFATETLVFKDFNGDSIEFVGVKRTTFQTKYFSNDPNGDEVMKDNCFGDYYYSENNSTVFQNPSNERHFELDLCFSNEFQTGTLEKQIIFNINNLNPTVYYYLETFCITTDSIFNSPSSPYNKVLAYYNSYQIGNKLFTKVYKLGCKSGNYLFYTMKDGLVGFLTDKYILYSLQK